MYGAKLYEKINGMDLFRKSIAFKTSDPLKQYTESGVKLR